VIDIDNRDYNSFYPITIDFSGVLLGPEKKLYCFFDGEVFFVDREFLMGA
jgi:hypothetical protein